MSISHFTARLHSTSVLDENPALTDGGNGRDDLSELKLVQDGGFSSGVETNCLFQKKRALVQFQSY